MNLKLYFTTNRNYEANGRFIGFGTTFQNNDPDLVRFGYVEVDADDEKVGKLLKEKWNGGLGNGEDLAGYLTGQARSTQRIYLYPEELAKEQRLLGSQKFFADLKGEMDSGCNVVVYVHGYNVDWAESVGAALTLEQTLNNPKPPSQERKIKVVLFSWPSDGQLLLYLPYKSDRRDARASGRALGRVTLFFNDFVNELKRKALIPKKGQPAPRSQEEAYRVALGNAYGDRNVALKALGLCGKNIHLLAHSMGAYVLESAIAHIDEFTPDDRLPTLVGHAFLLAADVDNNALEASKPLSRLTELSANSTIYFNRQDMALRISRNTKNNENRLGLTGPANLRLVPNGITSIDCTQVITATLAEHGYQLGGLPVSDIRRRIFDEPAGQELVRSANFHNLYEFKA